MPGRIVRYTRKLSTVVDFEAKFCQEGRRNALERHQTSQVGLCIDQGLNYLPFGFLSFVSHGAQVCVFS